MDSAFWPILAFVPFFFLLILDGVRRRSCLACGGLLSGFQSPLTKTRRQWLEGGYLCRRCGCESDRTGARAASGTGPSRVALLTGIALVAATWILAIALMVLVLWRPS